MYRGVISVLLLTVAFLAGCSDEGQSTPGWLKGDWVLSHNPQNDDNDMLRFLDDGVIEIVTEKGDVIRGHFIVKDRFLVMNLLAGRRAVEVTFSLNEDRSRLTYKNGAFYTRKRQ